MSGRGRYSANLLGTIKSHLEGLQGYEVMALELIQNADDAGAESIVFDVCEDALYVRNNETFTRCDDLLADRCLRERRQEGSNTCDFHRITDVASGGKLRHPENIGRFGIGFVSVYQITDRPEIISNDMCLTLVPEEQGFDVDSRPGTEGTEFRLPWAKCSKTPTRRALSASPVSESEIDTLPGELAQVLEESLLFLRNVTQAEVRLNGQLVSSFVVTRDAGSGRLTIDGGHPDASSSWYVLQKDANEHIRALFEQFPSLEELNRSASITLAIPLDSHARIAGRFFAYLPTEQEHGLSLHINADFFPEPERKAIILDGKKHQQAWNTALIQCAASALADNLIELRDHLSAKQLWQLIDEAYKGYRRAESGHVASEFSAFWRAIERTLEERPPIGMDTGGDWQPSPTLLHTSTSFNSDEVDALREAEARLIHPSLIPYADVLYKAGASQLNSHTLANLLENSSTLQSLRGAGPVALSCRRKFLEPLWNVCEQVLDRTELASKQLFSNAPLFLRHDGQLLTFAEGLMRPKKVALERLLDYLPSLPFPHRKIEDYKRVCELALTLDPDLVVQTLRQSLEPSGGTGALLAEDPPKLRSFYLLIRDLMVGMDREASEATLEALAELRLFRSGDGYVAATNAFLPGDFEDPIGVATLLVSECYDAVTQAFLREHLGVEKQSLENYVETQLPIFFEAPPSVRKYKKLLSELTKHPDLLESPHLKQTLAALRMVPTRDGNWDAPGHVHKHTEELEDLLGFGPEWWLDERRIPGTRAVESFLLELGVRESPCAEHVFRRLKQLTEEEPTREVQKQVEQLVYVLSENFDRWKQEDGDDYEQLELHQNDALFPAEGVYDKWFSGAELHAPYRYQAFASQAKVLPFRNMQRLSGEVLQFFGFVMEPATELVISNLRHFAKIREAVSPFTYQMLDERARKEEGVGLIQALRNEPCIWNANTETYLKPSQVFWSAPQLGRFGYQVPPRAKDYRHFLDAAGVERFPTPTHYIDIVCEICSEYGEGRPLDPADMAVMGGCLKEIALALGDTEDDLREHLSKLSEWPCIPTLPECLAYTEEVAVADSEWHVAPFGDEIQGMLTPDVPELRPLYEKLGVVPVSSVVSQSIDYVEESRTRRELAQVFVERAELFVRLIHDQPNQKRKTLMEQLSSIDVRECHTLRLKHDWSLGASSFSSEANEANAFFDVHGSSLYIVKSEKALPWAELLRSMFHALLPQAGGPDLQKLVFIGKHLLTADSFAAAEKELDDADVPVLSDSWETITELPESGMMGEFAVGEDVLDEETLGQVEDATEPSEPREADLGVQTASKDHSSIEGESSGGESYWGTDDSVTADQGARGPFGSVPDGGSKSDSGGAETDYEPDGRGRREGRKATGTKRRNRLRSYVRPRKERRSDTEPRAGRNSDHVYEVEAAARAMVCRYEEQRGRSTEEMPAMHPGYDIRSFNAEGNVERLIEVKGIDGEWIELGVGLKRRQFLEAWDEGDKFWLYVVEFAQDAEHACVHAIQNPAVKIDEYFFDQNWRGIAESGDDDLRAAFQPGARVRHHGLLGTGTITERNERGQSVELIIDFGQSGKRALPLNPTHWEIVVDDEEFDGEDVPEFT